MGSSIYQAVKNPNVLQIVAVEESNILLVLSVSMPQTLIKQATFTLQVLLFQLLAGMSQL